MRKTVAETKIDQMAKDLCGKYKICTCTDRDGHCSTPQQHARIMYELGYCKKEEAIKEFVDRFEHYIRDVGFTLGQTFEIQQALQRATKDMIGEEI